MKVLNTTIQVYSSPFQRLVPPTSNFTQPFIYFIASILSYFTFPAWSIGDNSICVVTFNEDDDVDPANIALWFSLF